MYEVDAQDRILEIRNMPQSDVGSPNPCVLATELRVVVAYHLQEKPVWMRSRADLDREDDFRENVAIIQFEGCLAHMFGPPNDQTLNGHPLAPRGLNPYGVFEVERSSWIRKLEHMNAGHPRHRSELYRTLRHLIFTFHDSTFECVCRGFSLSVERGTVEEAIFRTRHP